jgi:long-chain-fatty-acid---luciferin-component ligase
MTGVKLETRHRATDYDDLDELIYERLDAYQTPPAPATVVRWVADAADRHLRDSEVFRRLALAHGFSTADLRTTGDMSSVPLLSSGVFKRRRVTSCINGYARDTVSSGTRGSISVVVRDDRTLERFVGTVLHGLRSFHGDFSEREGIVLSPGSASPGGVWFSYVMTLVEILHDASFFVEDDTLQCEALADALESLRPEVQPVLVGPPALMWDLVNFLKHQQRPIDLRDRGAFALMAGGWKKRQGEVVRVELTAQIEQWLGIPPAAVRDVYNMVELNTVLFECEERRKHVPPWLLASARRPADLSIADDGEEGILAFIDPTALSYPAFVLSDDFGFIQYGRCECGREGPTLTVARRLAGIEERGCGLSLERYGAREHKAMSAARAPGLQPRTTQTGLSEVEPKDAEA